MQSCSSHGAVPSPIGGSEQQRQATLPSEAPGQSGFCERFDCLPVDVKRTNCTVKLPNWFTMLMIKEEGCTVLLVFG